MYFLCDRKYQRTGHTGKIFTSALCSRRILRALGRALARHFRLPLVFRVLRNLICTAIQEKLYPRKSSNSPRTMAWKQAALRWIFQRCLFALWRGITFAMKIYWNVSRTLTRTIAMSKKHRQCQNHNGNPCCLAAIVWGTSKRSTAIIFLKNCRTQCDPQHPTNSRKDWSGKFVTAEGCCKATREQKEQTTDFVSAGHFWCFLSGKKHVKNFVYKIDNMCSDRSHAAQT